MFELNKNIEEYYLLINQNKQDVFVFSLESNILTHFIVLIIGEEKEKEKEK